MRDIKTINEELNIINKVIDKLKILRDYSEKNEPEQLEEIDKELVKANELLKKTRNEIDEWWDYVNRQKNYSGENILKNIDKIREDAVLLSDDKMVRAQIQLMTDDEIYEVINDRNHEIPSMAVYFKAEESIKSNNNSKIELINKIDKIREDAKLLTDDDVVKERINDMNYDEINDIINNDDYVEPEVPVFFKASNDVLFVDNKENVDEFWNSIDNKDGYTKEEFIQKLDDVRNEALLLADDDRIKDEIKSMTYEEINKIVNDSKNISPHMGVLYEASTYVLSDEYQDKFRVGFTKKANDKENDKNESLEDSVSEDVSLQNVSSDPLDIIEEVGEKYILPSNKTIWNVYKEMADRSEVNFRSVYTAAIIIKELNNNSVLDVIEKVQLPDDIRLLTSTIVKSLSDKGEEFYNRINDPIYLNENVFKSGSEVDQPSSLDVTDNNIDDKNYIDDFSSYVSGEPVYNTNLDNANSNDNVSERFLIEDKRSNVLSIEDKRANVPLLEDKQYKKSEPIKIKRIRKPRFRDKIKKLAITAAAMIAAGVIVITSFSLSGRKNRDNVVDNTPNYSTEQVVDNNIDDFVYNDIDEDANELEQKIDQALKENTDSKNNYNNSNNNNNIEEPSYTYESNIYDSIKIGSSVKINSNEAIYNNSHDAMFLENSLRPYFSSNDNRVILGVSIENNNKITNVFACMDNANDEINYLLNNGGNIVSVLTGNKDKVSSLKNYNGGKISIDEVVNSAEGWYNVNSISNMKGNGYSK